MKNKKKNANRTTGITGKHTHLHTHTYIQLSFPKHMQTKNYIWNSFERVSMGNYDKKTSITKKNKSYQ